MPNLPAPEDLTLTALAEMSPVELERTRRAYRELARRSRRSLWRPGLSLTATRWLLRAPGGNRPDRLARAERLADQLRGAWERLIALEWGIATLRSYQAGLRAPAGRAPEPSVT